MSVVRRVALVTLLPVIRFGAKRRHRKEQAHARLVREIIHAARPGDVVATTRRRSVAAFLIPGKWSHVVLVTGSDTVVHATYPEVETNRLSSILQGASSAAVLRPRFARARQKEAAIRAASASIGHPYDFAFTTTPDAFYCSELIWRSYRIAVPEWKFELRERVGTLTVTPTDLYAATEHFDRIVTIDT